MEKRAILAILLMFIVLTWYNLLVAPRYRKGAESPPRVEALSERADTTVLASTSVPRVSSDTTTVEKTVLVRTPIYTACFSTRGAVLTSWKLTNYMGVNDLPVDLIQSPSQQVLPLATVLLLTNGEHLDLSGCDFKTDIDSIFVGAGERVDLRFELRMSEGGWLTKTFVLQGDSYHIFVKVNMSESVAKGIRAVETGLYSGLPSTEANKGDDLRNFACMAEGSEGVTKFDLGKVRKHRKLPVAGEIRWAASKTKYFLAAVDVNPDVNAVAKAFAVGDERIGIAVEADCKDKEEVTFGIYAGPLDYQRLKRLGIGTEKAVDFGWRWILPLSKLIFAFMLAIYKVIPNYGVVIIPVSYTHLTLPTNREV